MAQVRWRVITLLLWLALFFNIERIDLDLGTVDTINLPSVIYVVAIGGAILALLPLVQRSPHGLLLATAVTLAGYIGALLALNEPIIGEIEIYLTFTGIFMLLTTVALAYNVGRCLQDFLAAVEDLTFSDKGGQLRSTGDAQDLVHMEMIRSRRSQRPLSLMVIQADPASVNMLLHRMIQDVQRMMMQRYLLATLARVLSRYMRRTDIIIEGEQSGRLVVLAPETQRDEADLLGERLTKTAHERLGISASYSVAAFPDQALTYEELLSIAEQGLGERPAQLAPQSEKPVVKQAEPLAERQVGQHLEPRLVEPAPAQSEL
jgi:GGDEF domain-containing protein